MNGIKIPQLSFEQIFEELELRGGNTTAVCSAGQYLRPELGIHEILHHSTTFEKRNIPGITESVAFQGFCPLLIFSGRNSEKTLRQYKELFQSNGFSTAGLLAIQGGGRNIWFNGCLIHNSEVLPLDYLSLPGPRMNRFGIASINGDSSQEKAKAIEQNRKADSSQEETALSKNILHHGRNSRFAGALGDGELTKGLEYILKAEGLTVAVLGTGRMGSLLAYRLAQAGVGDKGGLILADGDKVEEANLDAMMLPQQAIGMPKALAVARMAEIMFHHENIIPIVGTLSDKEVAEALITADVIFSAVDEEYARVGAALLATRYHKVHIDASGGVAYVAPGITATGGELRISIPGSQGCVGCFGTHNLHEIEEMLSLSFSQEENHRKNIVWYQQRPGSWGDVLFPVVGEALQLFWRLIRGDITRSAWFHYEHQANGLPVWQDWTPGIQQSKTCSICSHQQGLGDTVNSGGEK